MNQPFRPFEEFDFAIIDRLFGWYIEFVSPFEIMVFEKLDEFFVVL